MRILVTWGSKRGGTEGIARTVAEVLRRQGLDVDLLAPRAAARATRFDAAVVGGALYANRWHPAARRLVNRQEKRLRNVPVWFFSSGPLDDSADRQPIAPTPQVRILMDRVGAQGHVTFGGRLTPDARGFPASAMAKKHAGDWRRTDLIAAWAAEIARALPAARPGVATTPPGRSLPRLVVHGLAGWAACALTMGALLAAAPTGAALALHALAAPLIFVAVSRHYFGQPGARDPLPAALTMVATVALLDLAVVAGVLQHSLAMFASFVGSWLPMLLIFVATWATGEVMSTQPWPEAPARAR
jgi:menaquinone-dependent protoporphyrinogen oxidase